MGPLINNLKSLSLVLEVELAFEDIKLCTALDDSVELTTTTYLFFEKFFKIMIIITLRAPND